MVGSRGKPLLLSLRVKEFTINILIDWPLDWEYERQFFESWLNPLKEETKKIIVTCWE